MSWVDKESLFRNLDEYRKVLEELTALCPNMEVGANDGNHRVIAPREFRVAWHANDASLRQHATGIHYCLSDLMDFGRPQIVQQNWHLWKSDFFTVTPVIERSSCVYQWEPARSGSEAYTDEEGEHSAIPYEPQSMRVYGEERQPVQLFLQRKAWGLGKWWEQQAERAEYFSNSSEDIRARWVNLLKIADGKVAEWTLAVRKVGEICIPGGPQ